jgi:hypothetical protein
MGGGAIVTSSKGSDEPIDVLCGRCGQVFSTFLHEMADQNAKVVCTNCRDGVDSKPAQATEAALRKPVKKPH